MKNLILPIAIGFAMAASASAQVAINEVRIDQGGSDNDEFFELTGPAGMSLDGLTYLVIGDATGDGLGGGIEAVIDLTGSVIPASGIFLAGEMTMTLGAPDLVTSINFENSDNVTHMLVDGFTGSNGDDVDTNDDGMMDNMPWASVVDRVVFVETPTSGDLFYGMPQVGPDGSFVPAHISLIAGTWEIGSFGTGYGDTPGRPNVSEAGTSFCDPASTNSTGGDVSLSGFLGTGVGSGLHLEAFGGPDMEFGYFLVGTQAVDPGLAISNGTLCLGGQFFRYNVGGGMANSIGAFDASGQFQNLPGTSTSGTGFDVPTNIPSAIPAPIMAGDTWHFQLWYRDTPAGVGTSNFSTGLTVAF